MTTNSLARMIAPCLLALVWTAPLPAADSANASAAAPATKTCKDGTTSTAAGRGACSGHGGVSTAKCKDGTYSKSKHRSGTCSKHGGVDQWLDGST